MLSQIDAYNILLKNEEKIKLPKMYVDIDDDGEILPWSYRSTTECLENIASSIETSILEHKYGPEFSSSTGQSVTLTTPLITNTTGPEILLDKALFGCHNYVAEENKEKDDMKRVTIPMPVRMIQNGPATVVFFADDTKVVVKLPEGVEHNEYNAFCAAITKKMFNNNTRIKRKIDEIRDTSAEDKAEAAKKAKAEAEERAKLEHEAKVKRMAKQIVLEKEAKALAKEMMEEGAR